MPRKIGFNVVYATSKQKLINYVKEIYNLIINIKSIICRYTIIRLFIQIQRGSAKAWGLHGCVYLGASIFF